VLRKRLGYWGIIFSDDMEMGGILKFMSMEEAAVAAIRAGMDLLEICHRPEMILRAYEALIAEGERSSAFRKLLLARATQTARQRVKLFAVGVPPALSARQFEALRSRMWPWCGSRRASLGADSRGQGSHCWRMRASRFRLLCAARCWRR
jgi:beta-N-acetylhexosaminidase